MAWAKGEWEEEEFRDGAFGNGGAKALVEERTGGKKRMAAVETQLRQGKLLCWLL